MDEQEVLRECYYAMSNVDYDLRRWKEELEQSRYGSLLDDLAEIEFARWDDTMGWEFEPRVIRPPTKMKTRELPLTWYDDDGVRHVIGKTIVDIEQGVALSQLDESSITHLPIGSLLAIDDGRYFAVKPSTDIGSPNYPEYKLTPKPFPKLRPGFLEGKIYGYRWDQPPHTGRGRSSSQPSSAS